MVSLMQMGDLAWTVLLVSNAGKTRAVATCAKRGLYLSSDLAPFGGSLCRYMAYQEVYLSSEYQAKEEKKDDKKSDSKSDKESDKKDDKDSGANDASTEHSN